MNQIEIHIQMMRAAELQFRLASAVWVATAEGTQPLDLPSMWTYGQHSVTFDEISLTQEGARFAAVCLEKSATYLIAVQIQEALTEWSNHKVRAHPRPEVRSAFEIARLIRNGFAHHPMQPMWDIDPPCRNKVYSVNGILDLDTRNINGKPFEWQHYGGPIAVLRLSEFVRIQILGDDGTFGSNRKNSSAQQPVRERLRQGSVVLNKLA